MVGKCPADARRHWRHYFKQYFAALHLPVQELAYPTAHKGIEAEVHDLEVIIRGASPDSIASWSRARSPAAGSRE